MSWASEYWGQFTAPQYDDWNDGQETCGAQLQYQKTDGGVWNIIPGSTGVGKGHAEMDALDQFFRNVCENKPINLAAFKKRGLRVDCPSKACCFRCSIILGALKFKAAPGTTTYKSARPYAKTQWSLIPTMRKFLKDAEGITEEMIAEISRMTSL